MKNILIVKQIPLISTLRNGENSMENMHTDVRMERVKKPDILPLAQ